MPYDSSKRSERPSHGHSHHRRSGSRSRSPRRSSHSHTHRHRHEPERQRSYSPLPPIESLPPRPLVLPFKSTPLSKHDLQRYKPMFASYLDIQKQIDIYELSEVEIKGRWKAFVGKWNRGELAEGWYDPQTLVKAITAAAEEEEEDAAYTQSRDPPSQVQRDAGLRDPDYPNVEEDDDDDWGPTLPPLSTSSSLAAPASRRSGPGPAIPSTADLALRDDMRREDAAADREAATLAFKAERAVQKERLEELAPRAEAGTRERQLEKRREAAASNRAFAEAGGPGDAEVGEAELMGGGGSGGGGTDEVKRIKANMERKKNEREIRREEVLRARAEEREERLVGLREREDKTMEMLKAIAKERFG